jgi:hypothetical protein
MDLSIISNDSSISNDSNYLNYSTSTIEGIDECSICFHPLLKEIAYLDCNHKFHFNCLSKWQKRMRTQNIICPICQQNSIIKTVYSVEEFKDISHLLKENNDKKNELLMKNTKYVKFPGIDTMDHSVICCNLL